MASPSNILFFIKNKDDFRLESGSIFDPRLHREIERRTYLQHADHNAEFKHREEEYSKIQDPDTGPNNFRVRILNTLTAVELGIYNEEIDARKFINPYDWYLDFTNHYGNPPTP